MKAHPALFEGEGEGEGEGRRGRGEGEEPKMRDYYSILQLTYTFKNIPVYS